VFRLGAGHAATAVDHRLAPPCSRQREIAMGHPVRDAWGEQPRRERRLPPADDVHRFFSECADQRRSVVEETTCWWAVSSEAGCCAR